MTEAVRATQNILSTNSKPNIQDRCDHQDTTPDSPPLESIQDVSTCTLPYETKILKTMRLGPRNRLHSPEYWSPPPVTTTTTPSNMHTTVTHHITNLSVQLLSMTRRLRASCHPAAPPFPYHSSPLGHRCIASIKTTRPFYEQQAPTSPKPTRPDIEAPNSLPTRAGCLSRLTPYDP